MTEATPVSGGDNFSRVAGLTPPPASMAMASSPGGEVVSGIWSETVKLQDQISRNFNTTNELLSRAIKLKDRIVRQRSENRAALQQVDARLASASPPASPSRGPPRDGAGEHGASAAGAAVGALAGGLEGSPSASQAGASEAARARDQLDGALAERDSKIVFLEEENQALHEALQECEDAMAAIMATHRAQVATVQEARRSDVLALTSELAVERDQVAKLQAENSLLTEQVQRGLSVLQQAAMDEDASLQFSEARESMLMKENADLRALLGAHDAALGLDKIALSEADEQLIASQNTSAFPVNRVS